MSAITNALRRVQGMAIPHEMTHDRRVTNDKAEHVQPDRLAGVDAPQVQLLKSQAGVPETQLEQIREAIAQIEGQQVSPDT